MKKLAYGLFGLLLLVSFTATGCSREGRSAGLGALGGAAAGVGGYEYQAHRERKTGRGPSFRQDRPAGI